MIALVILTHTERERLATHLPALLSQQGVDYEIIVVDMHSEDDTIDLLKAMEEEHHCLRHLALPVNAKDISYERLALHLGMRAAIASRVLLLDADTEVPSDHWLVDVLQAWSPDYGMVLVPTMRTRTKNCGDYLTAGHEAWRNSLYLRQSTRHALFRAGNAIVGLEKEMFLRYNAPAGLLALKTGAMDIFVARNAREDNTLVITDPALFPCRDACAGSHFWSQRRLFDAETSRHLSRRPLRGVTYMLHCMCTIHRGSLVYGLQDLYDNIRWCFTSKKTFTKKHY